MPPPLTDAAIERSLFADGGRRVELADAEEPGLRLRISRGVAKWSLSVAGPSRTRLRVHLGAWPELDVAGARSYSRALRGSLRAQATNDPDAPTLRQMLDLYERRRLSQLRKGRVINRSLRTVLADVVDVDPAKISRRDIAECIDTLAERAPIHANRALAYTKAFFGWCQGRGYVERNPAEKLAKPVRERPRERTPTLEELALIWLASGELGYPFRHAIRLLILTASRRDEVGAMRTAELEFFEGAAGGVWTIPAERSKNGRAIRVPLSGEAAGILAEALAARRVESEFVFTTTGHSSVSGWSKAKTRLDALVSARQARRKEPPIQPWRFHDFRRGFATQACDALGIDPIVADRCLNHVGAATTSTVSRIYGRSELFDARRHALHRWSKLIQEAVTLASQGDGT